MTNIHQTRIEEDASRLGFDQGAARVPGSARLLEGTLARPTSTSIEWHTACRAGAEETYAHANALLCA